MINSAGNNKTNRLRRQRRFAVNLSRSDFKTIQRWIYRNARPLDLARWQFHFENGSQEAVLAALSAYQNEDGGFGLALEPDAWNPNSSPYTTSIAIQYLEEIGCRDRSHPIIHKILHYLETTPDFDGERWPAILSTNADYPHAPWWTDAAYDWGFTPTALLAGFILFYGRKGEALTQKAERIAQTAIRTYLDGTLPDGRAYNTGRREGEIHGFYRLLTFLEATPLAEGYPLARLKSTLGQQAETFIEKDDTKWNQYCWKPSTFVRSPDSIFYPGNEKAIAVELDDILNRRNPEGIWNIIWTWGAYDEAFSITRNWWKANIIIENLRLLKSFGRF
jgi:hypothetical protein